MRAQISRTRRLASLALLDTQAWAARHGSPTLGFYHSAGSIHYGGNMAKRVQEQLGIEDVLWQTANDLRGNMDSSNYKHVVLGMLFLKYMFDVEHHATTGVRLPTTGDITWADVLDSLEERQPRHSLDKIVQRLEDYNPALQDAFPRFSTFEGLSGTVLQKLATTLDTVDLAAGREIGKDVLSRTYEYFLSNFAQAEGRLGGEFYTPGSIVRLMVELLQPFHGTVYDPACGTGGLLVQAQFHAATNGDHSSDIRVCGQESNPMTWRLGRLNLAMHGINADFGATWGDTFSQDQHQHLKADFILTNPPFGKGTTWPRTALAHDKRWAYGLPPENPANFAWLQHYVSHLNKHGVAVTVMPNGPLTSRGAEGPIRAAMIEADLVECIITLPTQLFYSTPIPVSLWILTNDKAERQNRRSRQGEVLLIDARELGHLTSKIHRDLSADDVSKIVSAYHSWQGRDNQEFQDIPGFAASQTIPELAVKNYSLNPTEYIPAEVSIDGKAAFSAAMDAAESGAQSLDNLGKVSQAATAALTTKNLGISIPAPGTTPLRDVRLGDIAHIVGGGTPNTKKPEYFGGDIRWITPKDLSSHQGRTIYSGARSLTQAGLDSSTARLVPESSILVSTRAPIGLVAMAGEEVATNQGIRSVVLHSPDHDSRFWYYVLKSSTHRLESAGNGTTFRELRGSSLADMRFDVPPFEVQVAIADYLSTLELTAEAARTSAHHLSSIVNNLAPALAHGALTI